MFEDTKGVIKAIIRRGQTIQWPKETNNNLQSTAQKTKTATSSH